MTLTNTYTSTDLQYVINEIWSPEVERDWHANLVAGGFFTNFSGMYTGGGDILNIAEIFTNKFTASTKSNATQVTLQSPAQGTITLTVDTWKEVSWLIEDLQLQLALQSSDYLAAYSDQAQYTIRKAFDTSLLALHSGLSQTVNDTASDVADADVRNAIETVVDGDVPIEETAFFFHPTVIWHDLFGITKYYDSSSLGTAGGPVAKGGFAGAGLSRNFRGRLYGIPVYETSQVQADTATSAFYNLLAHPKTFCYAIRTPGKDVRSQATYWAESLGTLWTTDIIYGVGELRDDSGVVIKSRQSGIVS